MAYIVQDTPSNYIRDLEKRIAALEEKLIDEDGIRKITRDEIGLATWRDLYRRHPELVQELQKQFPAQVPDLRELQIQPDSPTDSSPNQ